MWHLPAGTSTGLHVHRTFHHGCHQHAESWTCLTLETRLLPPRNIRADVSQVVSYHPTDLNKFDLDLRDNKIEETFQPLSHHCLTQWGFSWGSWAAEYGWTLVTIWWLYKDAMPSWLSMRIQIPLKQCQGSCLTLKKVEVVLMTDYYLRNLKKKNLSVLFFTIIQQIIWLNFCNFWIPQDAYTAKIWNYSRFLFLTFVHTQWATSN